MKKIITLAVVLTGLNSYAQEWAGSTTTTGTIYRTGSVGIGTAASTPSQMLDVDGNISVRGTHFVYNSQHGVIDWGDAGVGDLYFRTLTNKGLIGGYTDRMCILNNGNVGIGTTTPHSSIRLHVNGNELITNTTGIPTSAALIRGNSNLSTAATPEYTWWNNDQTGLFHPALNVMGFTINGTEAMRIHSNNYVGIGTASPSAQLHVKNNGATQLFLERSTNPISNQDNGLKVFFGSTAAVGLGGGTAVFQMTNPNSISDMAFMTNSTDVPFIIKNSGKIGIGTTSPTATLTVNGNMLIGNPAMINLPTGYKLYVETGILTEKIKVAIASSANWADYVFGQSYKLRPLSEVENYVKANKHLPGIPSAQEVVDNGGVDLGEMNVKLLEKVEELTLYLIEQNKKIEALQQQVNSIK